MMLGSVAKSLAQRLAQPLPQVFAGRMQGAGPESTGPRMERKEVLMKEMAHWALAWVQSYPEHNRVNS